MNKVIMTACAAFTMEVAARRKLQAVSMNDFSEFTFTNKIDHTDRSPIYGIYQQRYWTNDEFYDSQNGPVFLYLCGEWTCSPPDTSMYPFMVGASHDALLITLEHRYYGAS